MVVGAALLLCLLCPPKWLAKVYCRQRPRAVRCRGVVRSTAQGYCMFAAWENGMSSFARSCPAALRPPSLLLRRVCPAQILPQWHITPFRPIHFHSQWPCFNLSVQYEYVRHADGECKDRTRWHKGREVSDGRFRAQVEGETLRALLASSSQNGHRVVAGDSSSLLDAFRRLQCKIMPVKSRIWMRLLTRSC